MSQRNTLTRQNTASGLAEGSMQRKPSTLARQKTGGLSLGEGSQRKLTRQMSGAFGLAEGSVTNRSKAKGGGQVTLGEVSLTEISEARVRL